MNEVAKDAFSSPMLLNLRSSPSQNDNFLPLKWSYTYRTRDFHRNCMNYIKKMGYSIYYGNTQGITINCNHMKIKK